MTAAPIDRGLLDGRRLSAYVYDIIKERLLEGRWRAGQSIAIEALKSELGVSKQPVMDALRRLSADGLVEIIPQVGCRVPTYTLQETADFFRIFASAEAEATSVAATRRTQAQIDRLIAINQEIAVLPALTDPAVRVHQYLLLNRRFHGTVLDMAQSSVLGRLSSRMWDACDLIINTTGGSLPLADEIAERHSDHDRMIAAFQASNEERAREEMRAHILRNIPMLEQDLGAR